MLPPFTQLNSVFTDRPFHCMVLFNEALKSGFTSPIVWSEEPSARKALSGRSAVVPLALAFT